MKYNKLGMSHKLIEEMSGLKKNQLTMLKRNTREQFDYILSFDKHPVDSIKKCFKYESDLIEYFTDKYYESLDNIKLKEFIRESLAPMYSKKYDCKKRPYSVYYNFFKFVFSIRNDNTFIRYAFRLKIEKLKEEIELWKSKQ